MSNSSQRLQAHNVSGTEAACAGRSRRKDGSYSKPYQCFYKSDGIVQENFMMEKMDIEQQLKTLLRPEHTAYLSKIADAVWALGRARKPRDYWHTVLAYRHFLKLYAETDAVFVSLAPKLLMEEQPDSAEALWIFMGNEQAETWQVFEEALGFSFEVQA